MGMAKNYWMELQERGYGEASNTFVCEECFSGMRKEIGKSAPPKHGDKK